MANAEYTKKRQQKRKEQHRCLCCGKQDERTLAGKTNCAFCSKKAKLLYRENRLNKMNERSEK